MAKRPSGMIFQTQNKKISEKMVIEADFYRITDLVTNKHDNIFNMINVARLRNI